jgi:hypothetical protein
MNDHANHNNGTPPPWQRQPGESARAFAAFTVYRDLPATERSLDAVCRRLADDDPAAPFRRRSGARVRRRSGQVSAWSSTFHWVERATAWDAEKDRLALEAEAEAIREMRRQHAAEAVQFRQRALAELARIAEGAMTPAVVVRMFAEAVKIEIVARTGNQPPPWLQTETHDGRSFTQNMLSDPIASDLACELLRRVAGRPGQPGGNGVGADPGQVAAGTAPGPAQPQAAGRGGGADPPADGLRPATPRQEPAGQRVPPSLVPRDLPR